MASSESTSRPILVTGGAGFIGSHLVCRLVEQGEKVRVLEHPSAPVAHLPLDRIDLVRGDIRDRPAVADAVRGCGEVYHLAANPKLWTQRRGHFRQVNYLGAVNVLEAALAAGVRRVLVWFEEQSRGRAQTAVGKTLQAADAQHLAAKMCAHACASQPLPCRQRRNCVDARF